MITDRDKLIIEYLSTKDAEFPEIHEKFFHGKSQQWARKRLNDLCERGHIKKKKGIDDRFTIFYI